MKTDALKEKGLTQEQIDFVMQEYGKDLKALQKTNGDLEAERNSLKVQLETAKATLASFEEIDLDTIKKELAEWKQKAEDQKKDYESQIRSRDFDDALRAALEGVKFTSEAAKRDVIGQIKAANLNLNEGRILGLSDLLSQIREKDASAFVNESQTKKAKFTDPLNSGSSEPLGKTLSMREAIEAEIRAQK